MILFHNRIFEYLNSPFNGFMSVLEEFKFYSTLLPRRAISHARNLASTCANFCAAGIVLLASSAASQTNTPLSPKPSGLPIAGFVEFPTNSFIDTNTRADRKKYLNGKAALQREIDQCKKAVPTCNARIAELLSVIEYLRTVPDKIVQIELTELWVNAAIAYDDSEVKLKDHRNLTDTVVYRKGVCDEIARLKLYILEKLGFEDGKLGYIVEKILIPGQPDGRHADFAIPYNNRVWILGNQEPPNLDKPLTYGNLSELVKWGSRIETDATHLNFSRKSFIRFGCEPLPVQHLLLPLYGFNSKQATKYSSMTPKPDFSNVPDVLRTASAESTFLELNNEYLRGFLPMLKAAIFNRPHIESGSCDIKPSRNPTKSSTRSLSH